MIIKLWNTYTLYFCCYCCSFRSYLRLEWRKFIHNHSFIVSKYQSTIEAKKKKSRRQSQKHNIPQSLRAFSRIVWRWSSVIVSHCVAMHVANKCIQHIRYIPSVAGRQATSATMCSVSLVVWIYERLDGWLYVCKQRNGRIDSFMHCHKTDGCICHFGN